MGRPRKTESQRRAEKFNERYRMGKAKIGATEDEIGMLLGIERTTLFRRRKNPDEFSVGQLITLGKVMGWSDEDYLAIMRPER